MNIFYLDSDPKIAAQQHVNKHVVKMIIETAQILSTAHRILDGNKVITKGNGRKKTLYILEGEQDAVLYKAAHVNHPSTIWARTNKKHYEWLYQLFVELCHEYTYRYGKVHLTETKLKTALRIPPKNISDGEFKQPPQAMPEQYKHADSIQAYHNYYIGEKNSFAVWHKRETPSWYITSNK